MKKHILFVDDEPKILDGLGRMLRGTRHEWDMKFVESGPEALEILEKEPFDIVVSDMRMPGMDGLQLLTEVKKRYPHIVRIVLSGHSDQEMILKSIRPAHQYLSKPCDPETLKSTISRACSLRDLLKHSSLKRLVSQMESLPSLPSLYFEVMDELQCPEPSINKLGQIIAKDLGMSTKILQLVNSAFFGVPRHVSNPAQAVTLLGLDTVKALVLTVEVFSKFNQAELPSFPVERLWSHSIKSGAIAREIAKAENIDEELIDDAFMAGLLHDIGKLILATRLSENYKEVLELVRHQEIVFSDAEQQILGATHAEVGAYLLGLWGLPYPIVEVVAYHHVPNNYPAEFFGPLTAVHIANVLEYKGNHDPILDMAISKIDYQYLEKLNLVDRLSVWKETCCEVDYDGELYE